MPPFLGAEGPLHGFQDDDPGGDQRLLGRVLAVCPRAAQRADGLAAPRPEPCREGRRGGGEQREAHVGKIHWDWRGPIWISMCLEMLETVFESCDATHA